MIRVIHNGRFRKKEKSIGQELISELKPFESTMRLQLLRHGYSTRHVPFRDLVSNYYNEFVSSKNFSQSGFEPINCFEFSNHALFSLKNSDYVNGDTKSFRNRTYLSEVSTVVDAIIKTFKKANQKKQYVFSSNYENTGPDYTLTKDEKLQSDAVDKVTENIQNEKYLNQPITKKELGYFIIFAAIIYVIYVLCGN